jgi:hypothetical protein
MHNKYAGKQEYLFQRELCIMNMLESKNTSAEKAPHNEYAGKQEFLLQRELCIMNMLESKTTWCRESYSL